MKIFKGILFWVWSLTWGCIMTFMGLLVALALLITGHRPYRYHWYIYFKVGGDSWGGFECGPIFVTDSLPANYIKQHEAGHGLQNLILGPLMPFIVSIPSVLRYWFRELKTNKGRITYIIVVFLVFLALAAIPLPFMIIYKIPLLIIITCAIGLYGCIITGWQLKEYPKYTGLKTNYPDYDDFMWEGLATKWGAEWFGSQE